MIDVAVWLLSSLAVANWSTSASTSGETTVDRSSLAAARAALQTV